MFQGLHHPRKVAAEMGDDCAALSIFGETDGGTPAGMAVFTDSAAELRQLALSILRAVAKPGTEIKVDL